MSSIAEEITRLQTAKADIKTALENKGVTVPSSTKLDGYPTIINTIQTFDPYNGHAYVEIGGLKWATMNIGASSVTDYGLYFQWGDTTGYVAANVGASGTTNAKPFNWADYKFGNGKSSPGASGMTKYNSGDTKTVLDLCDDAARANWGGSWRMPTTAEFKALGAAVNTAWTQVNNVYGILCTDKTDSSKTLFFPAAGRCSNGSVENVGDYGIYWSSSLYTNNGQTANLLSFRSGGAYWSGNSNRFYGFPVRGVVG